MLYNIFYSVVNKKTESESLRGCRGNYGKQTANIFVDFKFFVVSESNSQTNRKQSNKSQTVKQMRVRE